LPRLGQFAQEERFFEAYDLEQSARAWLPNDPTLTRLMPMIADDLTIKFDSPGARLFKRFNTEAAAERQFIGVTPIVINGRAVRTSMAIGIRPLLRGDTDGKVYVVWGYQGISFAQLNDELADIVPGAERVIIPKEAGMGEGFHSTILAHGRIKKMAPASPGSRDDESLQWLADGGMMRKAS
jgi:hypothetical protein